MSDDSPIDEIRSFTVVSNMNLPYIDEMADYINETINQNFRDGNKELGLSFNTLIQPTWMQVKYLPKTIAIQQIQKAMDIFDSINTKFRYVYYQQSQFENIVNTLQETPPDMTSFFKTLDYVNRIYQKTDPTWDFYTQFPHLNQLEQWRPS